MLYHHKLVQQNKHCIICSLLLYRITNNNYKSLLLKSGFNPLQIICNHSASLLALNFDNKCDVHNVLCIDFGTFSSTFW